MVRYSCDMCGKDLSQASEGRFVLKMETFPALPLATLTDDDLDDDHLQAIGELLSSEDDLPEPTPMNNQLSYDLCPSCHKKFLSNPLNVQLPKFDFSEN